MCEVILYTWKRCVHSKTARVYSMWPNRKTHKNFTVLMFFVVVLVVVFEDNAQRQCEREEISTPSTSSRIKTIQQKHITRCIACPFCCHTINNIRAQVYRNSSLSFLNTSQRFLDIRIRIHKKQNLQNISLPFCCISIHLECVPINFQMKSCKKSTIVLVCR